MRKVEILAPGGSREAIYAGIYGGADAVYTGTSRFSARAFADNPSVEELCRILDFAHLHGKKIYLTVNTLLTEEELEKGLYGMLKPLYECGLDAAIVQDFGVLDFIREYFPELPIHASTQMTLLTSRAANFLKPYGVTRIVPARELTIGEIRSLRRETGLELEVFVHGALCYCYSGQCQMSNVIGGRSGNRGMCAQPCRLPWTVDDRYQGYFLSPKDMCTLGQVDQLVRAGVDSFKIEGRMKKPAYAAYTAHLYRLYADAAIAGTSVDRREVSRDIRRLADIYNRGGFSEGYLFEPAKKNIIYPNRNGHFGVCVGVVEQVGPRTVEYRVTGETYAQDVLEFRGEDDVPVYEYTLGEGSGAGDLVTARYKKGSPLRIGQKVYRTRNNALLSEISELTERGRRSCKCRVHGRFYATLGKPVSLELSLGDLSCVVTGAVAEAAKGRPVSAEDIRRRLTKTGESEFSFESLDVSVDKGLFVPLGGIAALRREAFDRMAERIFEGFRREAVSQTEVAEHPEDALHTEDALQTTGLTLIRVSHLQQIQGVKQSKNVNVVNIGLHFPLDEFLPEEWEELAGEAGDLPYYLSPPAVLREKNMKRFLEKWGEYGACFCREGCFGVIADSIEALPVIEKMADAFGKKGFQILAGSGLYDWNRRTEKLYREWGICGSIYTAYGRRVVMKTEGCVGKELYGCPGNGAADPADAGMGNDAGDSPGTKRHITIRTPKKDEFVVVNYCDYCYNMIYERNPARHEPEDLSEIPELSFTFEGADEVREVLEQWNFLS